jgi:hypothetical protein
MIDMGQLLYYLGIEVTQNPWYIFISQKKYIGELLNKFGMADCNPLYSNGIKFEVSIKRRE